VYRRTPCANLVRLVRRWFEDLWGDFRVSQKTQVRMLQRRAAGKCTIKQTIPGLWKIQDVVEGKDARSNGRKRWAKETYEREFGHGEGCRKGWLRSESSWERGKEAEDLQSKPWQQSATMQAKRLVG